VLVQRTPKGASYLKEIRSIMGTTAHDVAQNTQQEEKVATVRRLRRVAAA
jgi:hypothetical protein